jgi:hypothetical protein
MAAVTAGHAAQIVAAIVEAPGHGLRTCAAVAEAVARHAPGSTFERPVRSAAAVMLVGDRLIHGIVHHFDSPLLYFGT